MNIAPYQYFFCIVCEAKFLTPKNWLSREDEHKHSLTHENDADDPNYQKFISKLMEALLPDQIAWVWIMGAGQAPLWQNY